MRVWLRATVFAVVAAVLVGLPACGQLTDMCSAETYSWKLFSPQGFAPGEVWRFLTGP